MVWLAWNRCGDRSKFRHAHTDGKTLVGRHHVDVHV